MLSSAVYVTARLKPLSGPLSNQSRAVLLRFMPGVIRQETAGFHSGPEAISTFGQPSFHSQTGMPSHSAPVSTVQAAKIINEITIRLREYLTSKTKN